MKNRSKSPVAAEEIVAILGQLEKESDRGSALIAAALVDDSLGHYVRSHFADDPGAVDRLMGVDRPLGTFSARINLAYCLGWIGVQMRGDLDRIREIRNHFAHERGAVTFETQAVKARCEALETADIHNRFSVYPVAAPRFAYEISCAFIASYLVGTTDPDNRPPPNNDGFFGVYVKKIVERGDLQRIAQWLEGMERKAARLGKPGSKRRRASP